MWGRCPKMSSCPKMHLGDQVDDIHHDEVLVLCNARDAQAAAQEHACYIRLNAACWGSKKGGAAAIAPCQQPLAEIAVLRLSLRWLTQQVLL